MNLANYSGREYIKACYKAGFIKGFVEGYKQGIELGIKISQRQTAKSLFTAGVNIELIMAGTKLSREDILSLIEEKTQ